MWISLDSYERWAWRFIRSSSGMRKKKFLLGLEFFQKAIKKIEIFEILIENFKKINKKNLTIFKKLKIKI